MTANALTKQILEYLLKYGVFAWRQNNMHVRGRTFTGKKGVPDILAIGRGGKFIGIEVKVGRDEQSDAQRLFQSEVIKRGGYYVVARSLQDVIESGL